MTHAETDVDSKEKSSATKSWALLGALVFAVAYWFLSTGSTTCQALKNEVLPISKENANALQPRIIDIVEIQTTFQEDGELRCTGLAVLSNAMKQNVTFEKTKEYEQWWVKYEGQGLPFE